MLSGEARDALIGRPRKIEGQAQGIQRMLAAGRDCTEILNQLASVRAAARRASQELMKQYALGCLHRAAAGNAPEKTLDEMLRLWARVSD